MTVVKTKVPTKAFCELVNRVVNGAEIKAELESFRGFHVALTGGRLELTAATVGIAVKDSIPVDVLELFEASVPAQKLVQIASVLSADTTTLSFSPEQIIIQNGRSRFTVGCHKQEPVFGKRLTAPEALVEFSPAKLAANLKRVGFAAAREGRPEFSAIHLCPEYTAATDARVMAFADWPEGTFKVPVPMHYGTAERIVKILADCEDGFYGHSSDGHFIRSGSLSVCVADMAVVTPPFAQILKLMPPTKIKLDPKALAAEVKRAFISVEASTKKVTLDFKPGVCSVSSGKGHDLTTSETDCEIAAPFGPIHFNAELLLSSLKSLASKEVELRVTSPEQPVCFSEKGYKVYVNPIRF